MISIKDFTGEFPRTLPHLLPDNAAQAAVDCDFTQNALTGIKADKDAGAPISQAVLASHHSSLFAYKEVLMVFPSDSDPVPGPTAGDRYDRMYWTQTYPGYEYLYVMEQAGLGNNSGLINHNDSRITRAGVPAPVLPPAISESTTRFNIDGYVPVEAEVICETAEGRIVSARLVNWQASGGMVTADTAARNEWYYSNLAMACSAAGAATPASGQPPLPANFMSAGDAIMSSDPSSQPWSSDPLLSLDKNFALPAFMTVDGGTVDYYVHWPDWQVAPLPGTIYSVDRANGDMPSIYTALYHIGKGWYCSNRYVSPPNSGGESSGSTVSSTTDASYPALRVTFGLRNTSGVITERKFTVTLRNDYTKSSFPMTGFTGGVSATGGRVVVSIARQSSLVEARSYVYTYVNVFGEEGPPSPVLSLDVPEDGAVTLTLPGSSSVSEADTFSPVTKIRLYRTATGSADTRFLVAREFATSATVVYTDTLQAANLGEPLTTDGYYPPPRYLTGLISLPNGMLAAFKGREVWVSEPYLPYAWNPDNVLTTKDDIVSLCATAGGFYVVTKSHPYFVSGVTPDAMGQIKLDNTQAGVSKEAITNIGSMVVWASNDGLVTAQGTAVGLDWSYRFFTRDEWRRRYGDKLTKMRLDAHDGHLVVSFSDGTPGFLLRFDEANPSFTQLSFGLFATTTWVSEDCLAGIVYTNSQWRIVRFKYAGPSGQQQTRRDYRWWSKDFVLPKPGNLGCYQLVGAGTVTLTVFADGTLRFSKVLTLDDKGLVVGRLPGGFMARRWSFQVAGNGELTELSIAVSPEELMGV